MRPVFKGTDVHCASTSLQKGSHSTEHQTKKTRVIQGNDTALNLTGHNNILASADLNQSSKSGATLV